MDEPITDGLLLIDKPTGITSFDVIRKLRKITGTRKMGHTGTLDPFASGLLPILTGKMTRLSNLITHKRKSYRAVLELGVRTDTGDPEGEIVERKPIPDDAQAQLELISGKMLAITSQTPPAYSAVKIDGQRAYKLAREKKDVKLEPRPIEIFDFAIEKVELPLITYRAEVSAGTYIRVLSETIAVMLGTVGMSRELRRLSIGRTTIDRSVWLDDLTPENWRDYLGSPFVMIEGIPVVEPNPDDRERFMHGNPIDGCGEDHEQVIVAYREKIWGIAKMIDNRIHPKTVLI